jgi:hypothetical protein
MRGKKLQRHGPFDMVFGKLPRQFSAPGRFKLILTFGNENGTNEEDVLNRKESMRADV